MGALSLLEKRAGALPTSPTQGYAGASASDKLLLDSVMAFIFTSHTPLPFASYRDGQDLMALSVYLRTGGPNQAGAIAAINAMFDRIAANQTATGYWCYVAPNCDDSSTTQFAMAGLSAVKAVFGDPAYAEPGRLATLNALAANARMAHETFFTLGGVGGVLEPTEAGHGYRRGNASTTQQTASGTWIQLVGGADLNSVGVQQYLRWLRNRYRHTSIPDGFGLSDHYYLWSSFKAYEFIKVSGVLPAAGNIDPSTFGTLAPGSAPIYANREVNRDPSTDRGWPSSAEERMASTGLRHPRTPTTITAT